jgi:hypothetical protein
MLVRFSLVYIALGEDWLENLFQMIFSFFLLFIYSYMCIHCLGHFSPPAPLPHPLPFPLQFQVGPVLPLSLVQMIFSDLHLSKRVCKGKNRYLFGTYFLLLETNLKWYPIDSCRFKSKRVQLLLQKMVPVIKGCFMHCRVFGASL